LLDIPNLKDLEYLMRQGLKRIARKSRADAKHGKKKRRNRAIFLPMFCRLGFEDYERKACSRPNYKSD
jgi:hypothetical protein